MKRIEYTVVVQSVNGHVREFTVAVFARNITTGFSKAVTMAKSYMGRYDEMHSVSFSQVTS